jgi:hypothetical protein
MDLSQKESRDRLYDYHKHNLVYIGDYIKFADGKAGVALGATLLMLGFFGKEAKDNGISCLSISEAGLLLGLIPLIIACFYFIWRVLWPRYTTDTNLYMSWGGIGSFLNGPTYVSHIEGVSDIDFLHDMGQQNYSLAEVCIKKYKFLKYGFIWLTIGAIIESISWFFSK